MLGVLSVLGPFDGQQISWWEQDWTSEHGFGNAEEEEEEEGPFSII